MGQVIFAYNTVRVYLEFKEMERPCSIARHNETAALRNAWEEER